GPATLHKDEAGCAQEGVRERGACSRSGPGAGRRRDCMSTEHVAQATAAAEQGPELAPMTYAPGAPYDEMFTPSGEVRPHYDLMHARMATLGQEELEERQTTLERSFLLQGITFTVYGAEASTERIIPTDLVPRIIPAGEWAHIEKGLIQ